MAALDAAVDKQAEWAATPPNDRAGILWKAFELMVERADELATLMTLEMGKPLAESKAEILYAADFFRWFSGEALRIEGNYKQFANGTSRVLAMRQPVGPALMITPWNFPMAMGTRKVGRRSPPAARPWSSRPSRRRCRCWRWRRSSRRRGCRAASSTSSPPRPRAPRPAR